MSLSHKRAFLRTDLHQSVLVVGYPVNPGHEVIQDVFSALEHAGTSFPNNYNKSKILPWGTADIMLCQGYKNPDFGFVDFRESEEDSDEDREAIEEENTKPTISFEYGYSQSGDKLAFAAARTLLLTLGIVQLVVTVNVMREFDQAHQCMVLKKVTWAHWVVDGSSLKEADASWEGEVNDPQPDREVDEELVHPPPDAYRAVVEVKELEGEAKRYHIRCCKIVEHEVSYPELRLDYFLSSLLVISNFLGPMYQSSVPSPIPLSQAI